MSHFIYTFRKILPGFIFPLLLASCVSLKGVREFAGTATANVAHYNELGYSFLDHCEDRCRDEAIRTLDIQLELSCSCDLYSKADSVTGIFYTTIYDYLKGLGELAGKDLTSYQTDRVFEALSAEQYGPVSINESEAGAYAALSNLLSDVALTGFRKKKIAQYLEEADAPLQTLLGKFQMLISKDLKGELRFKKARLYSQYKDMMMGRTLDSDFENQSAVRTYYLSLKEIEKKEKLLDVYARSLNEIAKGHQKLYDERNQLSLKELTQSLLGYSEEIQKLYQEFNQLNR
ncbi:MAG: hypothetical protein EP311_05350 [Cytophagales bacterium]|nr:MAG: hypothetical protein EP311_05350 [Cytophagales bacterium]